MCTQLSADMDERGVRYTFIYVICDLGMCVCALIYQRAQNGASSRVVGDIKRKSVDNKCVCEIEMWSQRQF